MREPHVRFDEEEDAVAALELVAAVSPDLKASPSLWKWMRLKMSAIPLPAPVAAVCEAIVQLEGAYGRKFTIDGHLLGSIGEVVAREALGLELYGMSRKGHDGLCKIRGEVQIKITAKKSIALRHPCNHLIVLKMDQYGKEAEIVYDGPGAPIWDLVAHKKRPDNGQYQVSLSSIEAIKQRAADLKASSSP